MLRIALLMFLYSVNSQNCEGLKNGYYCIDDDSYLWCYGTTEGQKGECLGGTVCKCGKTAFNPCVWEWSELPDCEKKPGDFFDKPSEEPEIPDEPIEPDEPSEDEPSIEPEEPSENEPIEPEEPSEDQPIEPEEPSEEESEEIEPINPKRRVAYYTNWAQYRFNSINGWECKFVPSKIDPTLVDVINYAFVVFNENYDVKEYEWNDDQMIPQIVQMKSRNPNLKVLASIGGWNFNFFESTKHLFTEMAETRAGRAKFIQSAINFARKYNLDGIDIDWEYPGNEEQGGRPIDKETFTLLLKEFREAINSESYRSGNKLLLTIAAPAGPQNIENIEINNIHQYLDWINLMTYDLHGAWETVTGSHTALYATDGLSLNDCVKSYLEGGVPKSKLVVGLAHYGRGWTLVDKNDHEMGSPAKSASKKGTCTGEDGYLSKYEIDALIPPENIKYDKESRTLYGWYDDQFFTFDDKETFKEKLDYICENNLGGIMMWTLDLDKDYVNSKYIMKLLDSCSPKHKNNE